MMVHERKRATSGIADDRAKMLGEQLLPGFCVRGVMPFSALWDFRRKLPARAPLRVLFLRRAIGEPQNAIVMSFMGAPFPERCDQ
jgi:hypothetical protein